MAMTVVVYIVYSFILYSAYCFGMGVKTKNEEMIQSTSSTIRVLFFIKSSLLLVQAFVMKGHLEANQVILYGLDTLIVFVFTHFVQVALENPALFMKKRNKLIK